MPALALAQNPKAAAPAPSEAEKLFKEGRSLLGQKKYVEACPLFEKSNTLEPALGTLLNLADCLELSGKPARAFMLFNEAAAWASRNRETKREEVALQRAQALKPKLPFLAVELQSPPAGARASLFTPGAVEAATSWGLEGSVQSVPVDAGKYEVEVTAPGRKSTRVAVEVPATPGTVRVQVPALAADAPAMSDLAPFPPPPLVPSNEVRASGRSTSWALGIADVSLGGALLAGSVIGLIYTRGVFDRVNRQQPGGADVLDPSVTRRDFETARTLYYVSWAALGVGVAAIASGAWLLIREPSSRPVIAAMITSEGAFAAIRGSF